MAKKTAPVTPAVSEFDAPAAPKTAVSNADAEALAFLAKYKAAEAAKAAGKEGKTGEKPRSLCWTSKQFIFVRDGFADGGCPPVSEGQTPPVNMVYEVAKESFGGESYTGYYRVVGNWKRISNGTGWYAVYRRATLEMLEAANYTEIEIARIVMSWAAADAAKAERKANAA